MVLAVATSLISIRLLISTYSQLVYINNNNKILNNNNKYSNGVIIIIKYYRPRVFNFTPPQTYMTQNPWEPYIYIYIYRRIFAFLPPHLHIFLGSKFSSIINTYYDKKKRFQIFWSKWRWEWNIFICVRQLHKLF